MKKTYFILIIATIGMLQLSSVSASAQSRSACVPKNGYWVLVSNVNVKNVTTVQFYNEENQLMYEEIVRGQKMNINRLKTLRCLKKGLDTVLVAWNQQKKALYNKDWVAMNFARK